MDISLFVLLNNSSSLQSFFCLNGKQTTEVPFKGPVISLLHNCEVCSTLFRARVHYVLYSKLIKISLPTLSRCGLLYLFESAVFFSAKHGKAALENIVAALSNLFRKERIMEINMPQ